MPLDVLGRTRATLTEPTSSFPCPKGLGNLVKLCRAGDRALQLLLFNEEFLVGASHQLVPTTSLPLTHKGQKLAAKVGSKVKLGMETVAAMAVLLPPSGSCRADAS